MPAPLLIPLGIKAICWCGTLFGIGYVCKKGHDAYKQGQKTRREKYALKSKSLEAAKENNKRLNERDKEIDEQLLKGGQKEKELEKQANSIKKELEDPNISKERESELRGKLAFIQTQLDEEKKRSKNLRDEKEKNRKERENNNKIISGVGLNTDDKHWIWEFLTLENIMIAGACYVMYRILKDDEKK